MRWTSHVLCNLCDAHALICRRLELISSWRKTFRSYSGINLAKFYCRQRINNFYLICNTVVRRYTRWTNIANFSRRRRVPIVKNIISIAVWTEVIGLFARDTQLFPLNFSDRVKKFMNGYREHDAYCFKWHTASRVVKIFSHKKSFSRAKTTFTLRVIKFRVLPLRTNRIFLIKYVYCKATIKEKDYGHAAR
jgi:hypothetical protein